ncbi:MAG TPA: hypothetical protein VHZ07_25360 [Bryobacteraceae bacterium]|jgi:hypothetical protein|nr:hypothetical protein [Bryobacteraceae bacterium]
MDVVRYLLPLWLIVIAGLSLAPFRVKYHLGAIGTMHAFGHIAVFVVTTVLTCSGATDIWIRLCRAVSILLFAMLCEWLELAVYGNFHFEWHDVRIDWIGVALGFAISLIIHRVFEGHRTGELKCNHPHH